MYKDKIKLHKRQEEYKRILAITKDKTKLPLKSVALDVTSLCNMSCPHCYADTFMNNKMIDLKLVKKALDEFYELGVFHYILQGGEAINDKKRLEFILDNCYIDETYITIVSNGYKMTKDMIAFLKGKGVDKLAFSLDSFDEKKHDAWRMEGSYKRVMQAIDDTLESGLFCSVSTVVTRGGGVHTENFKKIVDFVVKKGIRLDTQIAMPVGKWDGVESCLITEQDAKDLKKLSLDLGRMDNGQYYITRDLYSDDGDSCPAAVSFMSLTADGHLLPCNFLQFSLGNIQDISIREAREKLMKSQWFCGKKETCLCGEDKEFIKKYIVAYKDQPKPLKAFEVFKD